MTLNLHPEALNSFNNNAENLLSNFIAIDLRSIPMKKPSFEPDHYISSTIIENEIADDLISIISTENMIGIEDGRFFNHNGNLRWDGFGHFAGDWI